MLNLIIQGTHIAPRELDTLARLTEGRRIERLTDTAYRIVAVREHSEIAARCRAAALDFAYVPVGRKLNDFRLAVLDMDSTLITIECIDEIADLHGSKARVAAITAAAMRGEIDYAESLRRRVGLLAGLPASALERVYSERLRLTAGTERLLDGLRAAGLRILLVSGGFTFFTERLKTRLRLDAACGNELEISDGRLSGRLLGAIVDADGKAQALETMRMAHGWSNAQVIAIGDGANDLKFLARAGVSIAFHAKPAVRQAATHCIDHVGLDGVLHLFE